MKRLPSTLSYANIVSTLCLFLLLGGTAYATLSLPKNSVGSKQLKPNSVTSTKIKPRSLATSDLSRKAISLLSTSAYTETESDARYLRGTITEVKSFKLGEGSGEASWPRSPAPRATRRSAAASTPPTTSTTKSRPRRRPSPATAPGNSSAKGHIRRVRPTAGSGRSRSRATAKAHRLPLTR